MTTNWNAGANDAAAMPSPVARVHARPVHAVAKDPMRGCLRRVALVLLPWLLSACASLPSLPQAQATFAPPPAERGVLAERGRAVEAELAAEDSAYWLLENNADSLLIRIALAELAVESLDIQYFIWQEDMTGRLLMAHVLAAADRGVQVRFFVDDLTLAGQDDEMAGLDAHPNIEVRVFNPWTRRSRALRPVEFMLRSRLLNHRMHNKVFAADGRFGIIGGRNIGDRYFGVYEQFVQNDIDLMMTGPILQDVMDSFDLYWNSELAHPLFWRDGDADVLLTRLRQICATSAAVNRDLLAAFGEPDAGWGRYFVDWTDHPTIGPGELLLDSPDVHEHRPTQLYRRFMELVGDTQREIVLSSPYLVPDAEFVAQLDALVEAGVDVRILTNSLASNSHIVAHSAYKRWRRALLGTGAEIYEMRADAEVLDYFSTPPAEPGVLALHTKAVVVDRHKTFIGSPNIDPRSMILNTEIGVVVEDRELGEQVLAILERDMQPENAWHVTMDEEGWLTWSAGDDSVKRQPATGFMQRFIEFMLNLIPIKNQT